MTDCPICEREITGDETLQMMIVEFGGDGIRREIHACKRCRSNIFEEGLVHA